MGGAYFAVGVPRVLRCLPAHDGGRREAVAALAFADCGSQLLAVVTTSTVQVWGGGQARGRVRMRLALRGLSLTHRASLTNHSTALSSRSTRAAPPPSPRTAPT